MIDILKKIYAVNEKQLHEMENALAQFPDGSLSMQKSKKGNRLYWSHTEKARGKICHVHKRLREKDAYIAEGLRLKNIYKVRVKAYRNNLRWLKTCIDHYMPCGMGNAIDQLKEPYRSLSGFESARTTEPRILQSENPYHRELLIHKNSFGESFRSKAEMNLSELLRSQGISYRYEMKLELDGEYKFPDFTIKTPGSGVKKYIEYFGMMDQTDYGESVLKKINWYLSHGFVPGRDVLFLFENSDSGMDLDAIMKQIHVLMEDGISTSATA